MSKRKVYSKEFKARFALDAIKGQKTLNELASEYKANTGRSILGQICCNKSSLTYHGGHLNF
jgi:hypothetical protein